MSERCPSCGAPAAASPACPSCAASLAPDASSARLTLVSRATDPALRRSGRLELTDEFRRRYRLERCLGSGSSGMVYRAVQRTPERAVAVKFLVGEVDLAARARFRREGELLARLAHPRVVRVLEAGDVGGMLYIVTDLLPGPTLRARMDRGPLAAADAREILRDLASGLAACHAIGVVHRDLKPENVMFDAARRACVLDLGLARPLEGHASLTQTGALVGTPRYMAPEQVTAEEITPAADLFALGCIGFEMIAGRPPFEGSTIGEMLFQRVRQPAPPLAPAAPSAPPALCATIDRCLARDPAARPASAAALADELAGNGAGAAGDGPRPARRPPRSRPPREAAGSPPAVRSGPPPARRPPLLFATLACGGLALAAALAALRPHPVEPPPPPSPGPSASVRAAPVAPSAPRVVRRVPEWWASHPGMSALAASRDGRLIASGAEDGTVRLWDRQARRLVWEARGEPLHVETLQFAASDNRVISRHRIREKALGFSAALYHTWDVATGKPAAPPLEVGPLALAPAPLTNIVPMGGAFGLTLGQLPHFQGVGDGVQARDVAWLPDRDLLMVREAAALSAWKLPARTLVYRVPARRTDHDIEMKPAGDGSRVAVDEDDRVTTYDAATGAPASMICTGTVRHVEMSADGATVAMLCARPGGTWTCFADARTGAECAPVLAYDGRVALPGRRDEVVLGVYERVGHAQLSHHGWIYDDDPMHEICAALGPDAKTALLRVVGGAARHEVWERATGERRPLPPMDAWIEAYRPSPAGSRVTLHGNVTGAIRPVWLADLDRATAERHDLPAGAVVKPLGDGRWLEITATGDLFVLDGPRSKASWHLPADLVKQLSTATGGAIGDLARPSRIGRWIALVGPQGSLDLVDAQLDRTTRLFAGDLLGHDQSSWYANHEPPAVFTADSRALIGTTGQGEVRRFDTATREPVQRYRGLTDRVTALALSGDDRYLAAGDEEGNVAVWFAPTGRLVTKLATHTATVCDLSIASDGRALFTLGDDRTLVEWELPPDRH